jgi:hypothetical protein
MKKALRLAWVLAVNGCVLGVTLKRLPPFSSRSHPNLETWVEVILEVFFPIVGIAFELIRSRFANWANVGYLTLAGCFWLGEALWWRSDPFWGVLLIFSVGFFVLAGLTQIIYRRTSPPKRTQLSTR